jgi:hypothetical protein
MKITILQPAYLPWLGFFDRIDASDLCVILDNVRIDSSSKTRFVNRNKIRVKEGWIWLTLPMKNKGLYSDVLIKDIELVQDNWNVKHRKSLEHSYKKAPFHMAYVDFLNEVYSRQWLKMQDLLDYTISFFLKVLRINTPLVKASELPVRGKKDELILNICKNFNAKVYYSGIFGRDYLNKHDFEKEGIEILFHEYKHPVYKQIHGNFEPYMCILDLLFNHAEESMDIIRKGRNFVKA